MIMKNKALLSRYDLVIVGGGLSGVCAAIAGGRLGLKTALINDRPVLGGNASSEIRVGISGAHCSGLRKNLRETGILEELHLNDWVNNPQQSPYLFDIFLCQAVKAIGNIDLFLNTRAFQTKVNRSGTKIEEINCLQVSTGKEIKLKGGIFIDASGDGDMAANAGAEFRFGRESKFEFNESDAPSKADKKVMGSTIAFHAKDMGKPTPFTPPEWAYKFPSEKDFPYRAHANITHGYWWIEYGGTRDTIKDAEEIRDELWKILFGVWDHIKNHGNHGADNYALYWVGVVPGKRESRRFIGDYILKEDDVLKGKRFHDAVAYGGWGTDLHPPKGIFSKKPGCTGLWVKRPYDIPFRCIYSKNIDNLMFAGRNISVTHNALGSTRIMGTCAILGQAAGTAAHLCKKYGCLPRDIYKRHTAELQQILLKNDGYIYGIKNRDKKDKAIDAEVTSSSDKKLSMERPYAKVSLEMPLAQIFPVSSGRLESIFVLMEVRGKKRQKITAGIRKAEDIYDFQAKGLLKTVAKYVGPDKKKWVKLEFNIETEPGQLYMLLLKPNRNVSWYYSAEEEVGLCRGTWVKKKYQWVKQWVNDTRGDFCFKLQPCAYPYKAANVVNGVSRCEKWTDIWISDPDKPFPQEIELKFHKSTDIKEIHLKFDTNLNSALKDHLRFPNDPRVGNPFPETIRDYDILCLKKGRWYKVHEEKRNYQRFKIHKIKFKNAQSLKIVVRATNGSKAARIYEVRVY